MHRYILLGLLVLLVSIAQANTTSLRQSRIYEGDIAELTIKYEASIPSLYGIDTSILEDDFEVLKTHSQVTRVVDGGQTLHRMQWSVQLLPRRSGSLRIAPLRYGENYSEEMLLEVAPVPAQQQSRQKVFIEVEAFPKNPYPGQQVHIVARLFHNVELLDGTLQEPEVDKAQVVRSGRDAYYDRVDRDEKFDLLERNILITPQSGSQLLIGAANYQGSFETDDKTASDNSMRYIHRRSKAFTLALRPLPAGFNDDSWLPARQLELKLAWDPLTRPPQPGDSLGVTLTLRALGLPAETLPTDLLVQENSQFKIYADQESRTTRVQGSAGAEQLVGLLQQRFAIIFDEVGQVTLPVFNLQWWDVEQDSPRLARLESTTWTVIAPESTEGQGAQYSVEYSQPSMHRGLIATRFYGYWPWLVLGSIAIIIAILLARLLSSENPLRKRLQDELRLKKEKQRCLKNLQRACGNNDARRARTELIKWGRAHWQDKRISGLHHIARRRPEQWSAQLTQLDAAVFAQQPGAWNGEALWSLVKRERRFNDQKRLAYPTVLPGPYPDAYS